MWPQKWNACASSTSVAATAPTPAATISAFPARARNPLREVVRASSSLIRVSSSGGLPRPPLGGGEDALQLAVAVERPLRADDPGRVERHRVRAARDLELLPHLPVAL